MSPFLALGMMLIARKTYKANNYDDNRGAKLKFVGLAVALKIANTVKYWCLSQYIYKAYATYWRCQDFFLDHIKADECP